MISNFQKSSVVVVNTDQLPSANIGSPPLLTSESPSIAQVVQTLKQLDSLDEQLMQVRRHLRQLQLQDTIFERNKTLLNTFEQLTLLTKLLDKFLHKENAISLFLLQNITQDQHEVRLQISSKSQPDAVHLLRNLAQFDSSESDIHDLQAILKDRGTMPNVETEEMNRFITYFKETMQKLKQAKKQSTIHSGTFDPQLLERFNEFISQIDGQISLMSLVLNKNFA